MIKISRALTTKESFSILKTNQLVLLIYYLVFKMLQDVSLFLLQESWLEDNEQKQLRFQGSSNFCSSIQRFLNKLDMPICDVKQVAWTHHTQPWVYIVWRIKLVWADHKCPK